MKRGFFLAATAAIFTLAASCGQSPNNNRTQSVETGTLPGTKAKALPETKTKTAAPADENGAAVYAVGMVQDSPREYFAVLWIDGKPTRLAGNKTSSIANAVVVTADNTIYIAGSIGHVATLWTVKDSKITALPLEKSNRYYSELKGEYYYTASSANSVFVTPKGDIYVAGENNNSGDKNLKPGISGVNATIWKVSGTEITRQIQQGMESRESSYAYSICVTPKDDTYVAGFQSSYNRQGFACLWINGEMHILSEAEQGARLSGVHVTKKGDVYLSGNTTLSQNAVAAIWKNQKLQPLTATDAKTTTYAEALCVTDGGDVYAAGYETDYSTGIFDALIWKNGTKQSLHDDANKTIAKSIHVTPGGNVYACGHIGDKAVIWKNGIPQTLTDGSKSAEVRSVFVVVRSF